MVNKVSVEHCSYCSTKAYCSQLNSCVTHEYPFSKPRPEKIIQVLDSVRATKALAAIEELVSYSLKNSKYYDLSHDEIDAILIKYGFMPCK